jgi:hypothetical protein
LEKSFTFKQFASAFVKDGGSQTFPMRKPDSGASDHYQRRCKRDASLAGSIVFGVGRCG